MSPADRKRAVLAAGSRLGFLDPRVSSVARLDREEFYESWLADGRAGDMRFLLHHKKARLDPRTRYAWVRSIVSAFVPYDAPPPARPDWQTELRGRIAAYAVGPDYHDLVSERLHAWADALSDVLPGVEVKPFVDTGAVFEHEWASRAGVGWTGKHTLTLSEARGSYAFLAELLVGAELEPDPPVAERCGTCRRCLDACPTGAIEPGYLLDPRRCISYLTIEHRGVIPAELRPGMGPWVFGCDVCQEVCPWNDERTSPQSAELAPSLPELLRLDDAGFEARFGKSALRRTGRVGLARNAAVVLGNTENEAAVTPLATASREHDAALVRRHAVGSLELFARAGSDEARRALEHARHDTDPDVAADAEASRARI